MAAVAVGTLPKLLMTILALRELLSPRSRVLSLFMQSHSLKQLTRIVLRSTAAHFILATVVSFNRLIYASVSYIIHVN